MTIFIITMILGWIVLAFAPILLQLSGKKERRDNEKSFRPGPSYRVQTYRDYSLLETGPASIKPLAEDVRPSVSPSIATDGIRHLTYIGAEREQPLNAGLVNHEELTIVDHNYTLKDGRQFTGNISVKGSVRIGSEAILKGSIKSTDSVVVSQDGSVDGDIESGADIRIESGASVSGSLMAKGHVWIYENARVGEPSNPCSIRGNEVVVAPTSRVHGAIWALQNGVRINRRRAA